MSDSENDRVVTVPDGLFSNSTAIAAESFIAPWQESIIRTSVRARTLDHEHQTGEGGPTKPTRTARVIKVNSTFKLIFVAVVAITACSGIAEIVMAIAWGTPSANQQTVFDAMDSTWKAGVGAIFGLLGGKAT